MSWLLKKNSLNKLQVDEHKYTYTQTKPKSCFSRPEGT